MLVRPPLDATRNVGVSLPKDAVKNCYKEKNAFVNLRLVTFRPFKEHAAIGIWIKFINYRDYLFEAVQIAPIFMVSSERSN